MTKYTKKYSRCLLLLRMQTTNMTAPITMRNSTVPTMRPITNVKFRVPDEDVYVTFEPFTHREIHIHNAGDNNQNINQKKKMFVYAGAQRNDVHDMLLKFDSCYIIVPSFQDTFLI